MKPKQRNTRPKFQGGEHVKTYQMPDYKSDIFSPLDDFDFNGGHTSESLDSEVQFNAEEEKRRIEALKRAIDIAKLMSNVDIEKILQIAESVDQFLLKQ